MHCARPELFAACLPDVGTMDIFRFHKFGAGPYIVSDVGSPEDPDEFKALRAISPYHNLKWVLTLSCTPRQACSPVPPGNYFRKSGHAVAAPDITLEAR